MIEILSLNELQELEQVIDDELYTIELFIMNGITCI